MAATDQFYRNQKVLNAVFGASCVLTLLVTIWMLYDDYNKPYKSVQREFRDVETLVNERAMLARLPEAEEVQGKLDVVKQKRAELKQAEDEVDPKRREIQAERDRLTAEAQRIKADLDSVTSYRDIETEKLGHGTEAQRQAAKKQVEEREEEMRRLADDLRKKQKELADLDTRYQSEVGGKIDPSSAS